MYSGCFSEATEDEIETAFAQAKIINQRTTQYVMLCLDRVLAPVTGFTGLPTSH